MQSKEFKIDKTYVKYLFYLAVIFLLRIDLVFTDNMPTGGDMGAHLAAVDYFAKNFFVNQNESCDNDIISVCKP